MNREQRRLRDRERAVEKKIEDKLKARSDKAGEIQVELYFTAFGLALNDEFGFAGKRIMKAWQRTDRIISAYCDGRWKNFPEMKAELSERCGVECRFH